MEYKQKLTAWRKILKSPDISVYFASATDWKTCAVGEKMYGEVLDVLIKNDKDYNKLIYLGIEFARAVKNNNKEGALGILKMIEMVKL